MIAARTFSDLVEIVRRRAGFENAQIAESAVEATLEAIGATVPVDRVRAAADQLPARAAEILRRTRPSGEPASAAALYRRAADREGVTPGFGIEHAQVVCEVLTELVSGEARAGLRDAIPELFRLRETTPAVVHDMAPRAHRTVAEASPGSTHPVSDSGPVTHVVENDEESTLASGHPGSTRPLSEGGKR